MRGSMLGRMDAFGRQLLPVALTFLLLLVAAVPSRITGWDAIAPNLALISVFYWSIYRPELMPAWACFLLGLSQDLLGAGPLGINALVLVLAVGTVEFQRKFFMGKPFPVTWWAFGLVALGAAMISWMLANLLTNTMAMVWPFLFSAGLATGLYPVLGWVLGRAGQIVLRDA